MIANEQVNHESAFALETPLVNIANFQNLENVQYLQISDGRDILHRDLKNEEEVKMNSLDINEDFNEQFETVFANFNFETCCLCNQDISNLSDEQIQLEGEKCLNNFKPHFVHKKCLISAIQQKFTQGTDPFCFDCSQLIYENDIFKIEIQRLKIEKTELKFLEYVPKIMQFSKKIGKHILDSMKQDLFTDHKVYVCKSCNHPNHIKDEIYETDQQKCLIECEKCKFNFCNQCKKEPYHFGDTCISYKASLENITCRFCKTLIQGNKQDTVLDVPAFDNVCNSQECKQLMNESCLNSYRYCGHACCGSNNEDYCLPCLHPFCVKKDYALTFGVCSSDLCSICYTEELGQAPVVQLNCDHMFHSKCLATILENKYSTLRISLGYLDCPICGVYMQSAQCRKIKDILTQEGYFKHHVEELAQSTAFREGIYQEQDYIMNEEHQQNPIEYAMRKLAMYKCFQCKTVYCGGRRDCEAELNEANQPKNEDILCVYCYSQKYGNRFAKCDTHDEEYLEHKCQYCCSVAVWFCFGATRFCNDCHNIATLNVPKICNPETCQWKGDHPPNGQPHCFGCKLCLVEIEHVKLEKRRLLKLAQQSQQYKQYQRYQAQQKWRNSWNILKAFQDDCQNEEIDN
eukprot:403358741